MSHSLSTLTIDGPIVAAGVELLQAVVDKTLEKEKTPDK
jgi:hypothetical protein